MGVVMAPAETRHSEVLTDKAMRQRAANLGGKIQAEDGVAKAVAVIEKNGKRYQP
jgi:sterol 3beta-glucosyltransferase